MPYQAVPESFIVILCLLHAVICDVFFDQVAQIAEGLLDKPDVTAQNLDLPPA